MSLNLLFSELLQATSQISKELSSILDDPKILSSSACPSELAGCTYPIVQLLYRQATNISLLHRSTPVIVSRSTSHGKLFDFPSIGLVRKRLDNLRDIAVTQFYAVPFVEVKDGWRRVYADTCILMFHLKLLQSTMISEDGLATSGKKRVSDDDVNELVVLMDMGIIVAGGNPVKSRDKWWMNNVLSLLEKSVNGGTDEGNSDEQDHHRSSKKLKSLDDEENQWKDYPPFPTIEPFTPPVKYPIPRMSDFTMEAFQAFLTEKPSDDLVPVIFTDLVSHWPALTTRPWSRPAYLQHSTFNGRRLVPVELGRSYTDYDWGQQLIPFNTFLKSYITSPGHDSPSTDDGMDVSVRRGYLAQHDLFAQVPTLRADVAIPDLCWVEPPLASSKSSRPSCHSEPRLNAWFGPAQTITPLHTDSTHNILVQVVGRKYFRLYHPKHSAALQPMKSENGIDMSNTAELDVGVEEGWDEHPGTLEASHDASKKFKGIEYWDCILEPGDSLYIPYGWWHYVRSLSISFSVSFWWT